MRKIIFVGLIALLVATGCSLGDAKLMQTLNAGSVTDADVVPTSFNESIKSTIKTDKGVFMVRGMPSVMKGEQGEVQVYDNGKRYLCFDSWSNCRRLYN